MRGMRNGLKCPRCGSQKLPVAYVRHYAGTAVRVRECKDCRHRVRTRERLESTSAR